MSKHSPFRGYLITADGRVISYDSNWRGYGRREMKLSINEDGYFYTRLTINDKRKKYLVHRLMAECFLSKRPSLKHEIRHLDGNKKNNRHTNLQWGTRQENANDREKHGHTSRGLKHAIAIKQGLERSGYNVKF